jgi:hypothetical protein
LRPRSLSSTRRRGACDRSAQLAASNSPTTLPSVSAMRANAPMLGVDVLGVTTLTPALDVLRRMIDRSDTGILVGMGASFGKRKQASVASRPSAFCCSSETAPSRIASPGSRSASGRTCLCGISCALGMRRMDDLVRGRLLVSDSSSSKAARGEQRAALRRFALCSWRYGRTIGAACFKGLVRRMLRSLRAVPLSARLLALSFFLALFVLGAGDLTPAQQRCSRVGGSFSV